jgi:ATP-dependent Clp protease adaptor protein ClpS
MKWLCWPVWASAGWGWRVEGQQNSNDVVRSKHRHRLDAKLLPALLMPDVDTDTEIGTETNTDIDIEFVVMDEAELERPYRVIIHNDNVTTFEFVINVLVVIFGLTFRRASDVAYEAHTIGNAYVTTLPLEEARSRVFKAQYLARQQGFPLTFTIEPA